MRLDQVPSSKGRKRNPDPLMTQEAAMDLIQVPNICLEKDCHFCKQDVAHATHISTTDYIKMLTEARTKG